MRIGGAFFQNIMKTLFIEARYTGKIELGKRTIDKLPEKIGIITTAQFADRLNEIKGQLGTKKLITAKGKQKHEAQVLGCDASATEKIKDKVDAFLYVGSGEFHPLWIAIKTKKPVYCFNPLTTMFSEISKKDIEEHEKKRKGALIRFLSSEHIGILASTKPGQNNLKRAMELKEKLKGKNCFLFAFDTLDTRELENFPFIECWVNTACPRIEGKKIINSDDVIF